MMAPPSSCDSRLWFERAQQYCSKEGTVPGLSLPRPNLGADALEPSRKRGVAPSAPIPQVLWFAVRLIPRQVHHIQLATRAADYAFLWPLHGILCAVALRPVGDVIDRLQVDDAFDGV